MMMNCAVDILIKIQSNVIIIINSALPYDNEDNLSDFFNVNKPINNNKCFISDNQVVCP